MLGLITFFLAFIDPRLGAEAGPCLRSGTGVFADIHDGDQKLVHLDASAGTLTVKPHANKQTWTVRTPLDLRFCNASVDFNVPGKPNPPPVNLTATVWILSRSDPATHKVGIEFTDPTGTLAKPSFPLNEWILLYEFLYDRA